MPDNSTSTTFDCKIVVPASHFLQLDSPVYQDKKKNKNRYKNGNKNRSKSHIKRLEKLERINHDGFFYGNIINLSYIVFKNNLLDLGNVHSHK